MTWIKTCGTTNLADAKLCLDAGADALGFVFYGRSARCILAKDAARIIGQLPKSALAVGVFVSASPKEVQSVIDSAGLKAIQLHRVDWSDPAWEKINCPKYLAINPTEVPESRERWLADTAAKRPAAILLDSGSKSAPGGTGRALDWAAHKRLVRDINAAGLPVVLAGGLNAANVSEAIGILDPWGVDAVSGIESSPGKKDAAKVRAFIEAVRGS